MSDTLQVLSPSSIFVTDRDGDVAYVKYESGTNYTNLAIALAVLIIICVIVYWFLNKDLSRRLARKGWMVYYKQGCYYCDKQKTTLNYKFNNYVECDSNGYQISGFTSSPPFNCGSPEISGYPFWYNMNTGESKPGYQDLESLTMMTV
jgi:hypothetical protein